ncbi:MAG: helix-turn-helix transcriptional regulator [Alphaproteobacteria bacterium]|nr:helix-turn-helix transcriptional regulator [Alphaproteobacteria bacterium]
MIKRAIGLRIKQLRSEQHITQEQLSFDSNLSRSYIGDVETGRRNISAETLIRIIKALKSDLKDFFNSDLFDGV